MDGMKETRVTGLTEMDGKQAQEISELLTRRKQLSDVEHSLKEDKDDISKKLMSFMVTTGYKNVHDPDLGSVALVEKTTPKLDQNKLRELLLLSGVLSVTIEKAFAGATTESKSAFVQYKPPKAG